MMTVWEGRVLPTRRGKLLIRTLGVLRLLDRAGGATLDESATATRVTTRTARRDLDALLDARVPVGDLGDERPKRWRLEPGFLRSGGLDLDPEELAALDHALGCAVIHGDGLFASALRSIRSKLRTVTPRTVLGRAESLARVAECVPPRRPPRLVEELPAQLVEAIRKRLELDIEYRSRSSRGPGTRRVEPVGTRTAAGAAYLVARDVDHDEIRSYRFSRIDACRPTGRTFVPTENYAPEPDSRRKFGVHGGRVATYRIRFAASAADHARERADQRGWTVESQPDGSVVVTLSVSGRVEVKSWVQSYGADALVLEPRDLANDIGREGARVAAMTFGRSGSRIKSARRTDSVVG